MTSERVAPDVLQRRLTNAVLTNDIDETKKCIDGGTHPDTICDWPRKGSSVLSLASYRGFSELVSFLVRSGANVEHIDNEYEMTPFLEASLCGHVPVVSVLVEFNCKTEARNKENNGALALACLHGHLDVVQFLIDVVGLAVNDNHKDEATALDKSASKGFENVCEFLLQREADIESLDKDGYTPFLTASCLGHVNVLKLLQQWKCNTSARTKSNSGALALACVNDHLSAVKFLVEIDLKADEKHLDDCKSLHCSASVGNMSKSTFLLEGGTDIECLDKDGNTPFLWAAYFGHVGMLNLFQQWKCNTLARNKEKNGAVALACLRGHLGAVQFLVDVVQLAVNDKHQYEQTLLHIAAENGHTNVCEFLLQREATTESLDQNDNTPFLTASLFGFVNVLNLLKQWRCNVSARNKDGNGALSLAVGRCHFSVVKLLLHEGVWIDEQNMYLQTALHLACQENHVPVAEFLISKGAAVNIKDKSNKLPHEYARGNLQNVLKKLLTAGSEAVVAEWPTQPVQDLIGDSPSQCIVEMSKILDQPDDIGDDWRRLWSELLNRPLNEDVVIQKKEGPTHFLLKVWCRSKPPSQATVGHLIQALNSIYRNDVARIVETCCKKSLIHPLSDETAGMRDGNLSVHGSQDVSREASLSEDAARPSGDLFSSKEEEGSAIDIKAFLASQGWHFDVFICHAGPDSAFIALLHAEMLKCGLKPFVGTKSLETGSNGQMTVAGAIVKSPFFLTVLSKGFQSSMDSESEIEAALSFPRLHKKIIPVFYQMSLDDCIEARKVLYHKLAAITGLHRGSKTDEQFAKSISQEMREMAVEQLQSNSLTQWTLKGDLEQLEQLSQLKDALRRSKPAIESVLDNLGPEGRQHFLEAIGKGTMKIARVNLDVVGDGEAGKSSLGDSLMDEPFIEKRESTEGANVIYVIRTVTADHGTNWKKDTSRFQSLGDMLARGSVLTQDTVSRQSQLKATESGAKPSQVPSVSDTEEGTENVSAGDDDNFIAPYPKDLESSSSSPISQESSQVAVEEKQVVAFQREFQKAKEFTEERAKAIKSLQDDQDELQKQINLVYISVCDRGGQEHYLPIHTTLIANCREFIPKAYLLVFDLTKRLSEAATATFRAKRGTRTISYTRCRPMKNEEIVSCWASAVDLAHPDNEMRVSEADHTQRIFLGRHKVRRGPPMFIIGTHYDEIVERGEEGQELIKEQEAAVRNILSKHKYIERVVAADDERNELIFKVDNTRSGTGSPDPVVNTLKQSIVDMALAYSNETEETPLPYVVLELGLLNVSHPEELGSTCNSEHKIVDMKDVVPLAQQYCDIKGQQRCQTALKYLSSVGAIFYFFKATGLMDKVFTDPQWLFDVMATFVTILGNDKVSHLYFHDVKQLKEEGCMSRQLAEHLLERRQELGVKPKHYNTIFRLLQLVDVFCPALSHQSTAKLVADDEKDFYVPCMLEIDYQEQTAWELSGAADVVSGSFDSGCHPPSLIFKPENVDSFPEPLFFRLSSRTAYQFPEFPQLKRNRIQVHFGDCDLELELLYHPTSQYVIATVFPSNREDSPTVEVVNRQCSYVRHFLCWQLNDAKQNGMDGFQYKIYFQVGKKPGTMTVDEESLCLLPNCDEVPKMIINPRTRTQLSQKDRLCIRSWYSSEASECGEDVLLTKSDLILVAENVQHQWMSLAGAMEPIPFYRNELIKFEDDTDNSESGKALRMLEEWRHECKHRATKSNLKRSLAAANLTHIVSKLDCASPLQRAEALTDPDHEVHAAKRRRLDQQGSSYSSDAVHHQASRNQSPEIVTQAMGYEKTGAGEESNVEHPDLELVLTAVMKCAPHEWYSIAVELGFSHGQIVEETSTIATGSGKLQRMVRVKADAVGNQETARLLLEACANIPHPVIGAVRERLQQLCRH